ncbi:hypothetical protein E4U42_000273 [Claviceps africana]|uniref:Bifunctional polynucleotide phosphatase/kinase n=1 Tax=Claviceps africana TaxID=83212 RepID=A0A8K0J0V8_9HYPO|nr:hypothetical protein E4U42_000273 [Claviceps africana]
MASANFLGKRKLSDRSISPAPNPIKRLKERAVNSKKANFFLPTSQKTPSPTTWSTRSHNDDVPPTLLVGRYQPKDHNPRQPPRTRFAVFDLDGTLIRTRSESKHASHSADWKWWSEDVPGVLRALHMEKGYQVIILSNQGGISLEKQSDSKSKPGARKRATTFKEKCEDVLEELDIPTSVYAATENDIFRKPRTGIWAEVCDDYDVSQDQVDLKKSFFVGDAAGRLAGANGPNGNGLTEADFSSSDRDFAANVGLPFATPDAYFGGHDAREADFTREFDLHHFPFEEATASGTTSNLEFQPNETQDMILFLGRPGAGKSSFFKRHLRGLGYQRINQDTLGNLSKCVDRAKDLLAQGKSVVIDNTNRNIKTREVWVTLAKEAKVPIRCLWFQTTFAVSKHNDAVRIFNKSLAADDDNMKRKILPGMAWISFDKDFQKPSLEEGFQDIIEIPFKFRGTRDEYKIWAQYWTDYRLDNKKKK